MLISRFVRYSVRLRSALNKVYLLWQKTKAAMSAKVAGLILVNGQVSVLIALSGTVWLKRQT